MINEAYIKFIFKVTHDRFVVVYTVKYFGSALEKIITNINVVNQNLFIAGILELVAV